MSFTLIQYGEVYVPQPLGSQSVLLAGEKVLKIGPVDANKLLELELPREVIDATGCIVTPGFKDGQVIKKGKQEVRMEESSE